MKKSREIKQSKDYIQSTAKLRLLVLLKPFQIKIENIRKRYGINPVDFTWLPEYFEKFENGSMGWDDLRSYEPKFRAIESLRFSSSIHDDVVGKNHKVTPFQKEMLKLGYQFNLPMNLVDNSFSGVPYYVLTNKLKFDRSYDVHPRAVSDQISSGMLNVRIYEKLNDRQLKELIQVIKQKQNELFKEPLKVNIAKRSELMRDLEIVEKLSLNTHKPRLVKEYDSVYLETLRKQGATSKQMKEAENKHRDKISYKYDQLTSSELAKTLKVKPEVVRTSKSRMNALSKRWFNVPLFP